MLTETNWTDGNQNVQIVGFHIDVSGGTSEPWAGAALYRCDSDSRLVDLTVENVTGDRALAKVGAVLLR